MANKLLFSLSILFTCIACNKDDYEYITSEDEDNLLVETNEVLPIINPIFITTDTLLNNFDFGIQGNKKYGDGKYSFINGGYIQIGKSKYNTVIIGNKRWLASNVEVNTTGVYTYPSYDDSFDELTEDFEIPTYYYNLETTYKFKNVKM